MRGDMQRVVQFRARQLTVVIGHWRVTLEISGSMFAAHIAPIVFCRAIFRKRSFSR